MHGAGGAAPRGNRNAWKHGAHSAEALALKKQINTLTRTARSVLHCDLPTAIRNQSLFSEGLQSFRNAGPADAKHDRQKLVSER
jgi:hypothetical protein